MKKGIFVIACWTALIFSSSLYAFTKYDRIAVQGLLSTSNGQAFTGIGLVDYGRWFELGFAAAGLVNHTSANNQSKLFLPSAFAGIRHPMKEKTYFAWGVNYGSKLGTENGQHIKSDYGVGPYISLEQWLTYNIMVVGYINPYRYERQVREGSGVSTSNQYFSSGGIAINYVFDYLHQEMRNCHPTC